jgi:hypothetical protein
MNPPKSVIPHIEADQTAIPVNNLSFGTDDPRTQEHPMLDFVMLALGLALFALTVGYAFACDRL